MKARSNGISDEHAEELHVADYDPAFVDPGHGNSRAGWTSVVVMLVAILLGTLFFFLDMPVLVWASAGLLLVGALLWPILAKAGFGAQGH
ncbi:hypothetical protein SAMN04489719_0220 [Agrococcus carbonis]|uniref:Uncharacterized protein n=1 Tax=Agrococcus carbonis TaxID=684552 RepID=A0A1H1KWS5_9MICO|nr:hypothetical protein SAMN04489719_0220 [Agrococcus carbonis]